MKLYNSVKDALGDEESAEVKRFGAMGEVGFTFFKCGMA
jgi:hypothetical protein